VSVVRAGGERLRRDDLPAGERLRVTEIFHSIQGEADSVGWPTVFVRLTGCPLRCGYCDTAYAFHGGRWMAMDEVLEQVRVFGTSRVTVTGGEPLAQKNCLELLRRLCDAGHAVSIETSGALPIAGLDSRVVRVMDWKTPGSGEAARNLVENLPELVPRDQVKFVICDRADYDWSRSQVAEHGLAERCQVLFSPSFGQLAPKDLADWLLADKLPVRLQLQIHKYLWGNTPGH